MAYTKSTLDHYDESMTIINRLAKLNDPMNYGSKVSLAYAQTTTEDIKTLTLAKNGFLEQADKLTVEIANAIKKSDDALSALRTSIGIDKGKDSDEYAFAGGIRQSDIIAKGKATREEKKKQEAIVNK